MKRDSRRTCPYPWLDERWTELLAVELAGYYGGRGFTGEVEDDG